MGIGLPLLALLCGAKVGCGHDTSPDGLVRQADPSTVRLSLDSELRVQVHEVLLYGSLRDEQSFRDLAYRGGFGEGLSGQSRLAKCEEDFPLSLREFWSWFGNHRGVDIGRPVSLVDETCPAQDQLVAGFEDLFSPDPAAIHERAVRRPKVPEDPAGGHPFQDRVHPRNSGVTVQADVVPGRPTDRDPVALKGYRAYALRTPDLQVLSHLRALPEE
jgi:hypothetical protein